MKKILLHFLVCFIVLPFISNAHPCLPKLTSETNCIGAYNYTSLTSCAISNVIFETECIDEENATALIAFDYDALPDDKVVISDSNGKNYGQFQANQQPLALEIELNPDSPNDMSFTVSSLQQSDCSATTEVKSVSCISCEIQASIVSAECIPESANYRLTLEVQSMGFTTIEDFEVTHKASGQFIGMFNNYAPSRPRLIAMTLPNNLQGAFTISDSNGLCLKEVHIEVDCTSSSCSISEINFETECIDANNFKASITFDYEAEIIDMVSVKDVLGNDYGVFDAAQQPLNVDVVLQETDSREFGFILTSIQDSECTGASPLQTIECMDCDINATTISTECIQGNEQYRLTLEVSNNGSSSMEDYTLTHTATGQFIGTFNNYDPSSPRIITAVVSNDLQGSFTIGDTSGECETTTNAQVNCDGPFCYLSNIAFETDCVDALNFSASIEFDYDTEVTEMVSVKDVHGNEYGIFDASQQPLNVDVVLQDTDSREFGFILSCIQDTDCIGVSDLKTIECIDCLIEVEEKHHECELSGDTYHVALQLTNNGDTNGAKYEVTHTATGQFIGIYSHFGATNIRHIDFYNPIDLQGEFTFAIAGTNCFTILNIEVDCTPIEPCVLEDVSVEYECLDEGQYQVSIAYEYAGLDTVNMIDLNGNLLGFFDVREQPIVLTIDDSNLTSEGFAVFVKNPNDETCIASSEALAIECETTEPCMVESIDIATTSCNDDGSYNLTAEYLVSHANGNLVSVSVNGGMPQMHTNTGLLTLENVTGRGNSDYDTIEICSTNDSDCCKTLEFLSPNCIPDEEDCALWITNVGYECDPDMGDHISFLLEVEGENTTDFVVKVNGVETGSGSLVETFTEVGPIEANPGGSYLIQVVDIDNDMCTASYTIDNAICELECVIGDAAVTTECIDNGLFTAKVTFPYAPNHTNGVRIIGNGVNYGNFDGTTQPIVLAGLNASDFDQWEFIVIDNQNETCLSRTLLGSVNCEDNQSRCTIQNVNVSNIECSSNEEYDMLLNFEFEGEEELNFTCSVNGVPMASTTTASLPLRMTGMQTNGISEVEVVTICLDDLAVECCVDYSYEKPNCLSNSVVDKSLLDGVRISPNPAREVVYISDIPQDVIGLTVVDNLGRTIQQIKNLQELRLDVSNYQNGIYTIQFFTHDNRVMSKRFVKL